MTGSRAAISTAIGTPPLEIYASFYFGPGRPNKPALSMVKVRPGFIDQLTGCIDMPCYRKGAMFHGRMFVQLIHMLYRGRTAVG
jgi:hypothetical protein